MKIIQFLSSKSIWNQLMNFGVMAATMTGAAVNVPQEDLAAVAVGISGFFSATGIVIRYFTKTPMSEK